MPTRGRQGRLPYCPSLFALCSMPLALCSLHDFNDFNGLNDFNDFYDFNDFNDLNDFDGSAYCLLLTFFLLLAGRITINLDPLSGSLSAVIRPPCRSTIFLQIASPMPTPG